MVTIIYSLSDLASSSDEENGEDNDDENAVMGKLREVDKPGWVMGKMSKTVQQRMETFRQTQMKHDELTQPGWGDSPDYFHESDKKYGTTELRVPAVFEPWTDGVAATPTSTTVREVMERLDIVPRILQLLQGSSWPGSSHMRLDCGKPQSDKDILCLPPDTEPDLSPTQQGKPAGPNSLDPCILPPALITRSKWDFDE